MSRNVAAIIQARTGSSRLPNKMLAPLGGAPLIDWVLRRVSRAKEIDDVILATSTLTRDDPLAERAGILGVSVFRGSEEDVLGRFVGAGAQAGATEVVRICADNPFIAPEEIDRLVRFFRENPCDYACNHQERLGNGYPDGFGAEILPYETLRTIASFAIERPHREHVTLYVWDHPETYTIAAVPAPATIAYPFLRFDIDTREDLDRIARFIEQYRIEMTTDVETIVRAGLDEQGNS